MPFRSSAQMRAAFSGALGPEMKAKADTWAHETPDLKSLPTHVRDDEHHALHRHLVRQHIMDGLRKEK
jgi:hypothetical protein